MHLKFKIQTRKALVKHSPWIRKARFTGPQQPGLSRSKESHIADTPLEGRYWISKLRRKWVLALRLRRFQPWNRISQLCINHFVRPLAVIYGKAFSACVLHAIPSAKSWAFETVSTLTYTSNTLLNEQVFSLPCSQEKEFSLQQMLIICLSTGYWATYLWRQLHKSSLFSL